jgi:hypothetical protein
MILKRPPLPDRLRALPPRGFGWIDHRFLRDGYLSRASLPALALHSLLVCACDQQGLSYYSAQRLCALLGTEAAVLIDAREELIALGLLAYAKPIYQLLALPCAPAPAPLPKRGLSLRAPTPPPPQTPAAPLVAAPPGLDLRRMVEASLSKGGAA